jgi:hypothetical protein
MMLRSMKGRIGDRIWGNRIRLQPVNRLWGRLWATIWLRVGARLLHRATRRAP